LFPAAARSLTPLTVCWNFPSARSDWLPAQHESAVFFCFGKESRREEKRREELGRGTHSKHGAAR
jgi:hypothetical protein